MGKEEARKFTTRESQMADKFMRRCSISFIIKAVKSKTMNRSHLMLLEVAKIKMSEMSSIGKN